MSVQAFEELVAGPVRDFEAACEQIGGLVAKQGTVVKEAFLEKLEFLKQAAQQAKPSDEDIQALLAPLAAQMGKVAEVLQEAVPKDPLEHHLTAISESISALGWVAVDSKPVNFVSDMFSAGEFYLSKLQMQYKNTEEAAKHNEFVKSVKAMYASLKAYVKEHHTMALQWNTGFGAAPAAAAEAEDDDAGDGDDALSAFKALLSGPVQTFSDAAKGLGGLAEKQSMHLVAAFNEELKVLEAAAKQTKPDAETFQGMLAPIGAEMGQVAEVGGSAPPKDPLENHLTAVSESVGALGWLAVDSKPVAYIGDMEGAGEFYLSKVLMQYKKTDEFPKHEAFVKSLRAVYAELKKYVKEYHTMQLSWNFAQAKPKKVAAPVADDVEDGGANPLSAFDDLLAGQLEALVTASKALGGALEPQVGSLASAFRKEGELLKTASARTEPPAEEFQAMLAPIAEDMGKVSEAGQSVPPSDPMFNHVSALAESVNVLGWVAVDSKPVAYIGDCAQAGDFYLSKVQMQYKKTDEFPKHDAFVKAVKDLYAELKKYVKEYHTMKLSWNFAAAKKPRAAPAAVTDDAGSAGADPLSAFKALLSGPVQTFSDAAKGLGGLAEKQSTHLVAAFNEELKVLEAAAKQTKPDAETFQGMLAPIGAEMGQVAEVGGSAPPKDPLENHLTAVSESVGALGWLAVDSKPVAYIGDMEGAGEFYLSKVLMQYKKTDEFPKHEAFVKSLRAVYAELKKYVKEYHTMQLSWNFAKAQPAAAPAAAAAADDDGGVGSDPITGFEAVVNGPVAEFVKLSDQIGGLVKKQADCFNAAFSKELELVKTAAGMAKPSDDDLQKLVMPVGEEMGKVMAVAQEMPPKDPLENHLTALSETVNALGWVMAPQPVSFISENVEAGGFYMTRVLGAFRKSENGKLHEDWVKALRSVFDTLKKYCKEHCPLGLRWNWKK